MSGWETTQRAEATVDLSDAHNPFEADWNEVERMLGMPPSWKPRRCLNGCVNVGRKITGRAVADLAAPCEQWRAMNNNQLLTLDQVHQPGEVLQTDGTWMNDLGISLQGEPFEHLVIHSVLPYSNWEWGRVVQSEFLLAIRLGLQNALVKMWCVPQIYQTDNTTAATHNLGPNQRERARKSAASMPNICNCWRTMGWRRVRSM